jgi:hypothetical protein
MSFPLQFTDEADEDLSELEASASVSGELSAVTKCLGRLELNPRHPGLHTHKYKGLAGPNGQRLFQSYAQNRTPAAYRVFWYYGPGVSIITVVAVVPHP